ncbi:polyunsaturated fatty acid 5-lipoxygenase isoform X1 [Hydra vulgaris]|uniref:polyunsaturated fatty acid 5-lipoxygenase isoform X1 n=1 Tax=Hydra vulgaris TaxID=6087 RepID=UPI001F5E84BF|nr:polyunsaturated fatty acid 5-lipoxygenase [Hydra vulgaris]XP_047133087.1 polyunsaturated fatty acid 5-lipoxygenase [Hydra vulgaris]
MYTFEFLLVLYFATVNGGYRNNGNYVTSQKESLVNYYKNSLYGTFNEQKCDLSDHCIVSLPSSINQRKCKLKKCFSNYQKNKNLRNNRCMEARKSDVLFARKWYSITDGSTLSRSEFPFKDVPFLNQSLRDVNFYTAINPIESSWLMLLQTWINGLMKPTSDKIKSVFNNTNLHNIEAYRQLKAAFEASIRSFNTPQYFDKPSLYPQTFTDLSFGELWKSNDIFAQRRLAGSCPFHLRKVTKSGEIGFSDKTLFSLLNKNYNFNEFINHASGGSIKSMSQAIQEGALFILYHDSYNDIVTQPDNLNKDQTVLGKNRTVMNNTSPITLFVLVKGEFKVAAIQIDYKPNSTVYSPSSPIDQWLLARAMVEMTDQDVCDAKVHLGFLHLHASIFCLSFSRHLSTQHPLYDLFKWHCYGTVPALSLNYPTLYLNNFLPYAMGNKGFLKLSKIGFDEAYYGQYDLEQHLKRQGLDDTRIKYYPYRDDARVISKELLDFSIKVVNLYYKDNKDVINDVELQSFANELSIDGTVKPDGGKGKVKRFPSSFNKKIELVNFLHQFLWFNILHSVSNYAHGHSFVPVKPTKLYHDRNFENNYLYNLPDIDTAVEAIRLSVSLDSFRANRLMDYSDKVQDKKFKELVQQTYCVLNSKVQKILEQNNAKRKAAGQLTFQYVEPKWLTNSIHV